MTKIIYLEGDATNPTVEGGKIIAHICNDIGKWGKGFVMAVSKRWPLPEQAYKHWYATRKENDFELGVIQVIQVEPEIWVANMIGQRDIRRQGKRPPIRYTAVRECLRKLSVQAGQLNASVHMPRIGCGLAGGKWDEIESIIRHTLIAGGIDVYVYDFLQKRESK